MATQTRARRGPQARRSRHDIRDAFKIAREMLHEGLKALRAGRGLRHRDLLERMESRFDLVRATMDALEREAEAEARPSAPLSEEERKALADAGVDLSPLRPGEDVALALGTAAFVRLLAESLSESLNCSW